MDCILICIVLTYIITYLNYVHIYPCMHTYMYTLVAGPFNFNVKYRRQAYYSSACSPLSKEENNEIFSQYLTLITGVKS